MESRGEAILSTLFGVSLKYQKKYCYPSQGTIQRLLFDHHKIDISNRTLNRDLLILVSGGYIRRVRRTKKMDGKGKVFTSTLYKFRKRSYIWLNSLAKWVQKVLPPFRLSKMADYKAKEGNEIFKKNSTGCGNPVDNSIEGKTSPVFLHG